MEVIHSTLIENLFFYILPTLFLILILVFVVLYPSVKDKNKPVNNYTAAGLSLAVCCVYTSLAMIFHSPATLTVLAMLHFITCLLLGFVFKKWVWILSFMLLLLIVTIIGIIIFFSTLKFDLGRVR